MSVKYTRGTKQRDTIVARRCWFNRRTS